MSTLLVEPGYKVGDPLGNLQRVREVQFTPHENGTATELVFDTGGNYFQAWYDTDMQYSTRDEPVELGWVAEDNDLQIFVPFTAIGDFEPWSIGTYHSVLGKASWWHEIDSAREFDYYDFLVAFFEKIAEQDEPAVCLEHDVIYRDDVHRGFIECDQPWCHHLYHGRYEPRNADELQLAWRLLWTGCQRFRPEIAPAALEILYSIGGPRRTWRQVGDVLSMGLAAEGWERHLHEPPVEHPLRVDGS